MNLLLSGIAFALLCGVALSSDKRSELFGKRNELFGKRSELFGKRNELFGKRNELFGKRYSVPLVLDPSEDHFYSQLLAARSPYYKRGGQELIGKRMIMLRGRYAMPKEDKRYYQGVELLG